MSHDDLDQWLADQTAALHSSLDDLLDIDAGLRDATLSDVQADMTQFLTPVLDVEAGLDSIHPQQTGGTRVLLVEPNDLVADALIPVLRRHGMAVHRLVQGREVLALLAEADVIVLELGLPDIDGITLVQQIRETSDVPMIAITARDAVQDRVRGLQAGLDDYLTKPFRVDELLARVHAIRRRHSPVHAQQSTRLVTFDNITVDTDKHEVRVAGELISLTRKEFEVLRLLVGARGEVLRREEILDAVWGSAFLATPRSLDVHIATLRNKLGKSARIEVVRGVGYRLTSESSGNS